MYTIENNVAVIKYTRMYGPEMDKKIKEEDKIKIIDENTLFEEKSNTKYLKSDVNIVGKWNCTGATTNDDQEVGLREVFGKLWSRRFNSK